MRKLLILTVVLATSMLSFATPQSRLSFQPESDSLFYETYPNDNKAVVIESEFYNKTGSRLLGYYPQKAIIIPAKITVPATAMGTSGSNVDLNVTEIAAKAFYKAKATSVTFVSPSNVTTIGTKAFSNMSAMSGKLTLPASLTDLAVSSILLPNITEIEFLGSVPPTCEISGGYNPWTYTSGSTPDSIKITVPEGAKEAYQKAAGIGDYFTCLKGTTTALGETVTTPATSDKDANNANNTNNTATTRKFLRNGILVIERNGITYDVMGRGNR